MGCKSNKILCISKTKADVIFLSDTRLNTKANKSGLNNLTKYFFFNGYNIYHNSLGPNRGTAILISSKLNTELINTVGDPLGNFIIIKCKINDKLMCLGSIYGPNLDENILIYDQIEQKVIEQDCESIILGGDWNCTWDCAGVDSNIDVLDMASIPSKNRSERLKKLCNKLKLTDPYRVFYPTKRDFTYIPAILQNTNRSRLDFFCISKTLINKVGNSQSTALFPAQSLTTKVSFLMSEKKQT